MEQEEERRRQLEGRESSKDHDKNFNDNPYSKSLAVQGGLQRVRCDYYSDPFETIKRIQPKCAVRV